MEMAGKFRINYENTPFLATGTTGIHVNRLNWRAEVLLTRNLAAVKDKRILDLASHDGRFSWACLRLGASHVTGVEVQSKLVKVANQNLTGLGYGLESFNFVEDDVFNYLQRVKPGEFDTILCLGFFYHTVRQIELLSEVKRIKPEFFVLDTMIAPELSKLGDIPRLIRKAGLKHLLHLNRYPKYSGSLDRSLKRGTQTARGVGRLVFTYGERARETSTNEPAHLRATPTKSLVETLFESYGFTFQRLRWNREEIRDWTKIQDYKTGARVSYLAQLPQAP